MSRLRIDKLIYIDRLQLVVLSTSSKVDSYNVFISQPYDTFRLLYVVELNLTVNAGSTPKNTFSLTQVVHYMGLSGIHAALVHR